MAIKRVTYAHDVLEAMLEADKELYEKCLDTQDFAWCFNELVRLAEIGSVTIQAHDLMMRFDTGAIQRESND